MEKERKEDFGIVEGWIKREKEVVKIGMEFRLEYIKIEGILLE